MFSLSREKVDSAQYLADNFGDELLATARAIRTASKAGELEKAARLADAANALLALLRSARPELLEEADSPLLDFIRQDADHSDAAMETSNYIFENIEALDDSYDSNVLFMIHCLCPRGAMGLTRDLDADRLNRGARSHTPSWSSLWAPLSRLSWSHRPAGLPRAGM